MVHVIRITDEDIDALRATNYGGKLLRYIFVCCIIAAPIHLILCFGIFFASLLFDKWTEPLMDPQELEARYQTDFMILERPSALIYTGFSIAAIFATLIISESAEIGRALLIQITLPYYGTSSPPRVLFWP
jgi:hypothetical protein